MAVYFSAQKNSRPNLDQSQNKRSEKILETNDNFAPKQSETIAVLT